MRIEKDSMGEFEVPESAKYGASTARAVDNFPISELRFSRTFIKSLAEIKKACAVVNQKNGLLDENMADAIIKSAQEVIDGDHDEDFILDIFQTGSGTSTNMNANEVIANLASEMSGITIHPNDHVNMSQSSNDIIPTATNVASVLEVSQRLIPELENLSESLTEKSKNWEKIYKNGRTHLMDATPVTLGQEFSGYASLIKERTTDLQNALDNVRKLAIGGTAVGTGINSFEGFAESAAENIAKLTGLPFKTAANKFEALAAQDCIVELSGSLKTLAVSLFKIANDIRWLASGPRSGIGEIIIPSNEPGSSIMPGKVNPTQCEAMTMVCTQVMGNDLTISMAGAGGNFELNVYRPVIAYNIVQSIRLLNDACDSFRINCVDGIIPHKEKIKSNLYNSLMLVTALNPHIGYDKAAKVAKKAHEENTSLREAIVDLGYMSGEDFDKLVDPRKMTKPSKK